MVEINKINKVIIVGGGIAGWTVAAVLANSLKNLDLKILVLSGKDVDEVSPWCDSATPAMCDFNKILNIQERDFIRCTQSAYSLAVKYKKISEESTYYMPFSGHGFMLNRLDFSKFAVFARLKGDETQFDEYSLSSMAARGDRFCHPSTNANSLFSTITYGFQINIDATVNYFRDYAKSLAVEELNCRLNSVDLCSDSGEIKSISVTSGLSGLSNEILTSDLFIDCTGEKSLLMGSALNVGYESAMDILPSNRMCVLNSLNPVNLKSSISIEQSASGWIKEISTQTQSQITYLYHSDFSSDEKVFDFISRRSAENYSKSIYSINPGRRNLFWHKNCVSIGHSAGYLQDMVVSPLHLIQSAALRLVTLFPLTREYYFSSREYNRLTSLEYRHIIDFHHLHYRLASENSSDYWSFVGSKKMTETLKHRLSAFFHRGIMPFYEGETLSQSTWISFLLGANKWPVFYDPVVDNMSDSWITENLNKMKRMIGSAAQKIPSQSDYLKAYLK